MSVDIYLLLERGSATSCPQDMSGSMLRTLDGVKNVEERELRDRRLLKVVYDPLIGSSTVILKAMERIGCRASLIGL